MDKSVYIGTATCIISATLGAGVPIAVGAGMITQNNAIYFLVVLGILFLIGVGFLIYGIRLKPKTSSTYPINQQPGTGQAASHKLLHSIICEIAGAGLIVWGAYMVSQDPLMSFASFIGFLMVIFGFSVFVMGVSIGVSK